MNNQKIVIKLACLIGYLAFAAFSAFFTATSLSLSLMEGEGVWYIFALVVVISILAGWCLSNVIEELQKPVNASKSRFLLNLIGFIIFWGFSFTTNVHYFFVEKHGYATLERELSYAEDYLTREVNENTKSKLEERDMVKQTIVAQINNAISSLQKEIFNTTNNGNLIGFGPACISILRMAEANLRSSNGVYHDKNDYVIYDEKTQSGYVGIKSRTRLEEIYNIFSWAMENELKKKENVIDSYYKTQIDEKEKQKGLLDKISQLREYHLPEVRKDTKHQMRALFRYKKEQGTVLNALGEDFQKISVKENGDFIVYPSERMFDTMQVWKDIFNGRLHNKSLVQWILLALLFDLVSFILFVLFRNN